MKRSPLRRGSKRLRRLTPLRSRPSRRARAAEPLATWCEAAVPTVCSGLAEHRHHIRLRSQGGTDGPTTDVCLRCHDYIHRNPAWAYAHGFLLRQGRTA